MKFNKHPTDPGMDYYSNWQCGEKDANGKLCLANFDEYDQIEKHYEEVHAPVYRAQALAIKEQQQLILNKDECKHELESHFKGLMFMDKEKAQGVFIDVCKICGKEINKGYKVNYKNMVIKEEDLF